MVPQYLLDYIIKTKLVARHHTKVTRGTVYVLAAIDTSNGVEYVTQAAKNGAKYAVVDYTLYKKVEWKFDSCQVVPVENTKLFWAFAASLLYCEVPCKIIAVTGTSGKSSVAYICAQIAAKLKQKSLYIGTLGAITMSDRISTKIADTLTTPDIMDLRRMLSGNACDYACLEVSSHALTQHRVDFLPIHVAGFTNLSPEHLDYHQDMESYYRAKERLFTNYQIKNFVWNADNEYSKRLADACKTGNIITYGKGKASLQLVDYVSGNSIRISYEGKTYDLQWKILGKYNAYNFMCAVGMLLLSGFQLDEILAVAHDVSLPEGRMEKIIVNNIEVYIDYAHKPDALQEVLKALQEYREANAKGKIWAVFGCGGDRDIQKRPLMGKIASDLADKVIVTDDNPRSEAPELIRQQIIEGTKGEVYNIGDREKAIEFAIRKSEQNDLILIAGKGHEKNQIVGDAIIQFSDAAVVRNIKKCYMRKDYNVRTNNE